MRPKFQKQSALKFDGRIIPEAKPSGINVDLIPCPLGRSSFGYPAACGGVVHSCGLSGLEFGLMIAFLSEAGDGVEDVANRECQVARRLSQLPAQFPSGFLPLTQPDQERN